MSFCYPLNKINFVASKIVELEPVPSTTTQLILWNLTLMFSLLSLSYRINNNLVLKFVGLSMNHILNLQRKLLEESSLFPILLVASNVYTYVEPNDFKASFYCSELINLNYILQFWVWNHGNEWTCFSSIASSEFNTKFFGTKL